MTIKIKEKPRTLKGHSGSLTSPEPLFKLNTLVKDLAIDVYHGTTGTWSSTQFKDILKDEALFIRKYIKKEVPREEKESFDTGTYFHTAVLEPHKVDSEIAVFAGKTRYGKNWDRFKLANYTKTVISSKQKEQGDIMIAAVKESHVAQEFLDGDPEVSLFITIVLAHGNIYAPKFNKVLTRTGWREASFLPGKKEGFEIVVKVRADMLGEEYISDLKSTSGNARDEGEVRSTISRYKYDLSAALYLDMFSLVKPDVKDFIWIFASKDAKNCATYRATQTNILIGRAKYMKAMRKMETFAKAKWELLDYLRDAEPLPHELEWLNEKETDLL